MYVKYYYNAEANKVSNISRSNKKAFYVDNIAQNYWKMNNQNLKK